ncbi:MULTISPECIES: BN159_2729 family protein [unclassified Streptomyces]|uniref:BN159_2729 family protein n=1 Tax=unclassified Streptomyces TaxID=2593676 RepID=UPI002741FBE8|nr:MULTISPECIES: BN159_2729 family protein [unclassified Streptomyces]
MSPAFGKNMDVEQELMTRLGELARAFIADLNAQGRLVEIGGAEALRHLREQHDTRQAPPRTHPGGAEATDTAAHLVPRAPAALWEAITTPATSRIPPSTLDASHPLHLLYAPHNSPHMPERDNAPDNAPAAAHGTGTEESHGTHESAMAHDGHGDGQQAGPEDQGQRAGHEEQGQQAGREEPEQSAAARTAASLRAEHAGRLDVTRITADHDRVTVHIEALSLADWEYWLSAIGAPVNAPTHPAGGAQTATGQLDGVEIHLTADAVPRLLDEAARKATEPYCLAGRVYDLALPHTDRHGQTWQYHGQRQEDDTPLLTLHGTGSPPYPLTSILTANGPLIPSPASADRDTANGC